MNQTIESLYQEIGSEALQTAGGNDESHLIVYANVSDGVVKAEVYPAEPDRIVFKFSSARLGRLMYDFWCEWRTVPGNREWRAILYRIDGGKFQIEFIYPEKFDETESTTERRSRLAQRFFGDRPFDYQNPRPDSELS